MVLDREQPLTFNLVTIKRINSLCANSSSRKVKKKDKMIRTPEERKLINMQDLNICVTEIQSISKIMAYLLTWTVTTMEHFTWTFAWISCEVTDFSIWINLIVYSPVKFFSWQLTQANPPNQSSKPILQDHLSSLDTETIWKQLLFWSNKPKVLQLNFMFHPLLVSTHQIMENLLQNEHNQ